MLGSKYKKEFIEKASSDISCRQFMVNENLIRYIAAPLCASDVFCAEGCAVQLRLGAWPQVPGYWSP